MLKKIALVLELVHHMMRVNYDSYIIHFTFSYRCVCKEEVNLWIAWQATGCESKGKAAGNKLSI